MSLDAARFQSIYALTGMGLTTKEAETTIHHPPSTIRYGGGR
jgi:hypothetical protein